jgi:hypothetical protein
MYFIDRTIENHISTLLRQRNEERDASHVPSGRLSASMLNTPVQWQILKNIGVPQKEFDDYTLRKFLRGTEIESWLLDHIPNLVSQQVEVYYKDCIGYIDAVIDSSVYQQACGLIPLEVKSVSNMKYKRVLKDPDKAHLLQAAMYALGMEKDHFGLIYVSTDDLRTHMIIEETKKWKNEVDKMIDEYNEIRNLHIVPTFSAKEEWQKKPDYQNYPDWAKLTAEEIVDKLQKEFPEQYKNLTEKGATNG